MNRGKIFFLINSNFVLNKEQNMCLGIERNWGCNVPSHEWPCTSCSGRTKGERHQRLSTPCIHCNSKEALVSNIQSPTGWTSLLLVRRSCLNTQKERCCQLSVVYQKTSYTCFRYVTCFVIINSGTQLETKVPGNVEAYILKQVT